MIQGKNLTKIYESGFFKKHKILAVDNVDIRIEDGETYCLIGESGSGKSTLGKLLLLIERPTKGEIIFDNTILTKLKSHELRKFRRKIQLIPQYPESSFNPRWTIYESLIEPLKIHKIKDYDTLVREFISIVGLNEEHLDRYPHELSGGELQRVMIARAFLLKPKFVVCDEPTSMLDVSVQASILRLLLKLQKNMNLSYLFITHDLDVAKIMGDKFGVMFAGQIVEEGSKELFDKPLHPYTENLIKASKLEFELDNEIDTELELKNLIKNVGKGCKYYNFCPYRKNICKDKEPPFLDFGDRKVRCHQYK